MPFDDNIQNISQLVAELKTYVQKQKEYTTLQIVEKLSILFSMLIFVIILINLGLVVLFYLSLSLVHILEPHVGGLVCSYAIVAGFTFLFALIIAIFRKALIINPVVNFIAKLFLN